MKLIPDWKSSWKFNVMQALIILSLIDVAMIGMYYLEDYLPPGWYLVVSLIGKIGAGFLRLRLQPLLNQSTSE